MHTVADRYSNMKTNYNAFNDCIEKYIVSIEISHVILTVKQAGELADQLDELFAFYPEWRTLNKQELAWLLGVRSREAISRAINGR